MKKNILLLGFILFFSISSVSAQIISDKIYAVSAKNIDMKHIENVKDIHLYSIDEQTLGDNVKLEKNAELIFSVKEKIDEKRGKRSGYLKGELISYTIPSQNNKTIHINKKSYTGTLRNSTPKDLKEIGKKAGIAIVGHVLQIPGFSQAVAVSKGLIKPNENQTRLASAGTNLYKSTPLTFFEKGKPLLIEENSIVIIKLKEKDSEEE